MDDAPFALDLTPLAYEEDVAAWSRQQAAFLSARRFELLDVEHLADEIEDVGKSERHQLESRLEVLLAHLLKWQVQPDRLSLSGKSWRDTIRVQRNRIDRLLKQSPSLRASLRDDAWIQDVWEGAVVSAAEETRLGLDDLSPTCPWPIATVLDPGFYPSKPPASP